MIVNTMQDAIAALSQRRAKAHLVMDKDLAKQYQELIQLCSSRLGEQGPGAIMQEAARRGLAV